jgi:hypothetical protein
MLNSLSFGGVPSSGAAPPGYCRGWLASAKYQLEDAGVAGAVDPVAGGTGAVAASSELSTASDTARTMIVVPRLRIWQLGYPHQVLPGSIDLLGNPT